jgi:hypothetical protein
MATDLFDTVPALKRAVAVPGTFPDVFPSTTDADLSAILLDAFSEAQLDGFFPTYTSTDDGLVTEDLTRGEEALIVIYAAIRIIQSQIRNTKSHVRYEAGEVVFEQDYGSSTLNELLKQYAKRKEDLIDALLGDQTSGAREFMMADQYLQRVAGTNVWLV